MKETILIAYKMVRLNDPVNHPGVYSSYFRSRVQLHYRIGKKTIPAFGPVFLWDATAVFSYIKPYAEVDKENSIHVIKCNYVEYDIPWDKDGYCNIINPLCMVGIDRADILLFWKTGQKPKCGYFTDWFINRDRTYNIFAKWVKPIEAWTSLEVINDEWIKGKE
jgi:hypothetical protein